MSIDWNAAITTAKTAVDWPADTYKMSIDGASWDKTKTGKDRLKIRMICAAGPKTGKFLFWDLVMTPDNPKAIKFFIDRLASVGVSAEYLAAAPSQEQIVDFIRSSGDDFMVTVEVGEFNGQPTTEVRKVVRA